MPRENTPYAANAKIKERQPFNPCASETPIHIAKKTTITAIKFAIDANGGMKLSSSIINALWAKPIALSVAG